MATPNTDLTDDTSGVTIIDEASQDAHRPASTPLADANPTVITNPGKTGDSLDALFEKMTGEKAKETAAPKAVVPPTEEEEEDDTPSADQAAKDAEAARVAAAQRDTTSALDAGLKANTDAAAAKDKVAADKVAADKAAADKVAADKAAADKAVVDKADALDKVQLPPHAKAASRAAFDSIKAAAREQIASRDAELKILREQVAKAAPAKPLTPEVEKELTELREFQRVHAYQNSTEFKTKFGKPVEEVEAAIDAQFKESGFDEKQIAEARKIGLDKLDWKAVFEKLPQSHSLNFNALLLSRQQRLTEQKKALAESAPAAKEFADRQEAEHKRIAAEEAALVTTSAKQVLDSVDWFKEQTIPADATAEKKLEIEETNKFVKEQQARFADFLQARNDPAMIGSLIAGTVAAYHFRRDAEAYKARAESAEAELSKIIKSSSSARVARAAVHDMRPAPTKTASILKPVAQSLDDLRDEVLAGQK